MDNSSDQEKIKNEQLMGSVISDYDTLDYRFTEMYRDSIPEATMVMIQWFEAFCKRDLKGMGELMNYPYFSVEENRMIQIESPEDLIANPPTSLDVTKVDDDTYDMLDCLETRIYRPAEVGFSLSFSRYQADGIKCLQGEDFYSIFKDDDGIWKLRRGSTIRKSPDQFDSVSNETIEAARRILHLYMYTWGSGGQAMLNKIGWPRGEVNYEQFRERAGSRLGGYDDSIACRIDIPQHSDNKAHCMTTFIRRQADGRPITINRTLYIIVKENGHWRWSFVCAQAREHDFSNDTR
ncbi:hypothetical protein ACFL7M_09110 [Thermodesulfobacteriota bacterium]